MLEPSNSARAERRPGRASFGISLLCLTLLTFPAHAAPRDRISGAIDSNRTRAIAGSTHRLAQAQYDQGEVSADLAMKYMVMLFEPSAPQQVELSKLLADQQNPASPSYHKWLTPEEFGDRFGISAGDLSKITAWLKSQGFTVEHQSRAANWVAFSGTASQTSRAFHTSIHSYAVNGGTHFANATDPSVPEALSGMVGAFLGLNDFPTESAARMVAPQFNIAGQHLVAPADFSTIYDLTPLQQAGLDGTGQSIAVVGESDVMPGDLATFRQINGLPAATPKMVLYNGVDPGFNGAEVEGALDLEWAGAIAPNATLYYVYGASAVTAMVAAIETNLAPVISISYGGCEANYSPSAYEALGQQANAQGITIIAASGDSGSAGCDSQGFAPFATLGRSVDFPAVLPEVTGVGGTAFVEGSGSYWSGSNSKALGSALSYIPETAWNESGSIGLLASGGGGSRYFAKPAWQTGPGVPNDSSRDVPDVAFSAAMHDGYSIVYQSQIAAVAGTSCGTPAMAAITALLNQMQIKNGAQTTAGLGNINPQLYRLAQSAPSAFHDITSGDNIVNCAQGTAECAEGSFGYQAGPGYDQATGLGSIDAGTLFAQWTSAAQGVKVTLTSNAAKGTINDSIQFTATVDAANGSAAPTGSVSFTWLGGGPLGTVPLTSSGGKQTASLDVPLYTFGAPGSFTIVAQYSGDAVFSSGGAAMKIQVTTPTGVSAVIATGPNSVASAVDLDAQGLSWSATFTLHEYAGVPALITSFSIDGQTQPLSQYYPSPNIPAGGTLMATVTLRNVPAPVEHTFTFSGVDVTGASWSRQLAVNYYPPPLQNQYSFTAAPLTVTQTSNAACQFPVQVTLNDEGGFPNSFVALYAGTQELVNQLAPVFGTTRLQAWSALQGTICVNGVTPPGSDYIYAIRGDNFEQQAQVNFAPAPANPTTISVSPASISLSAATVSQTAQATFQVSIGDKSQPWTATIYPANRTSGWLSASQLSGTGAGQITLTASGFGFEPGAYHAWIVIQSQNAQPQTITVPVMFVLGAGGSISITRVANPASGETTGAPGMLLSVFGTNLASSTVAPSDTVLPYSAGSVTATVNNIAAPLQYVSANQINIQIPYEAGAGPAVVGINNNGQVAGFQFQIAPAAPAIYTDGNGNITGNPTVAAAGSTTLYLNGAGDVNPPIDTASLTPSSGNIAPVLPLSVTVGGVPAFVKQAGLAPGTFGTMRVQFYVPANAASGSQPVVVTVNGVASLPVNVTVK